MSLTWVEILKVGFKDFSGPPHGFFNKDFQGPVKHINSLRKILFRDLSCLERNFLQKNFKILLNIGYLVFKDIFNNHSGLKQGLKVGFLK